MFVHLPHPPSCIISRALVFQLTNFKLPNYKLNKIALVTGTSSGIGMLTAVELALGGFHVVATMRNPAARATLDELAAREGVSERVEVRRLDVTDHAALPQFIADIVRDHQRIDVLVNNAGFSTAGFAEDVSLPELREQFETNFFSHVAVTKAVMPIMRQQHSGHIIMISSMTGVCASVGISSYSASKWALEGWSESFRLECLGLGIKVILIEPGAYETSIWEKNVKIAAGSSSPDSPNKERSQRFVQYVRTQINKRDAREVARLIRSVAENPNPNLRYMAGRDAKGLRFLKRLLPWKRYERMILNHVKIDR
jgi:NAD(P)-dependent dehydrogenase (short-subunit alcohol dehydrogenase family)